jgi:two-component system, NtrC family, sensor kinase
MPTRQKQSKKPALPKRLTPPENVNLEGLKLFISGTMYEIQHPVKGLLDSLQDLINKYGQKGFEYIGYKEFREIIKKIELMRDQTRRCFDITERILSLNRKKAGLTAKHCEINDAIKEALKMIDHDLQTSEIKIKLHLSPKIPCAAISPLELNHVLVNVFNNALQSFPGAGGVIHVRSYFKKDNQRVYIECKDEGVGISKEILPRIFDPFFTTKQRGLEKSSGLGLTVVQFILDACGGKIDVRSDLRKGTLVSISIPAIKA